MNKPIHHSTRKIALEYFRDVSWIEGLPESMMQGTSGLIRIELEWGNTRFFAQAYMVGESLTQRGKKYEIRLFGFSSQRPSRAIGKLWSSLDDLYISVTGMGMI